MQTAGDVRKICLYYKKYPELLYARTDREGKGGRENDVKGKCLTGEISFCIMVSVMVIVCL